MGYQFSFMVKGNYIDGQFKVCPEPSGEWVSRSPADATDELGVFHYAYRAIDEAVSSARGSAASWRRTPVAERAARLKKFQAAVEKRREAFVEVIAREVGRPAWEAGPELDGLCANIDVTIEEGNRFAADFEIPKIMDGTVGASRRRPLGVAAVIGSFSLPAALPCAQLVPALLTGNSVVFKPSEKSPMVGQLLAECFHEAEFPSGVFNLLQGDREVSRRLCVHEGVDAILFTGSYEVGTRIKQDTLQQHWKLLSLQMGGKNAAIVWGDADLEHALHETLVGAFSSAGQRCNSTSRVIVHSSLAERFTEALHERAKAFKIGHPLTQPFMGPLIDATSMDRYMKFQGIASREGCDSIMRGKSLDLEKLGNYVAPSIYYVRSTSLEATRRSVYQQTEILGPNVAILSVNDLDEAVAQANATQYGLVASVFSKNRGIFDTCFDGLQFGMINWNRSTIAASSRLPWGGRKKSGNHLASGVFSSLYCTYPVASLETAEPRVQAGAYPGLNWK